MDEAKPAKQKSRLKISHAQNDARYVEMGKMLHISMDPNADQELASMNEGKNGHPFKYANLTIMSIAGVRVIKGPVSYRMCQGMAVAALGEENAPDHVTLWRRINALDVGRQGSLVTVRNGSDVLCLIPDATGLAPATRSDWIHHKHRKARGFVKLSAMINEETMEILAFRVTDERKGDSSQLEALVDDSLEVLGLDPKEIKANVRGKRLENAGNPAARQASRQGDKLSRGATVARDGGSCGDGTAENATVARDGGSCGDGTAKLADRYGLLPFCEVTVSGEKVVLVMKADGGYDTRKAFAYCKGLGIVPLIKVQKNSNCRAHGVDRTRGLAVQEQLCGDDPSPKKLARLDESERLQNQKNWKKRVGYGRRWLVEIVFSSFKRMFGTSVSAVKMEYIVREIAIRIKTYNTLLTVAREAIART